MTHVHVNKHTWPHGMQVQTCWFKCSTICPVFHFLYSLILLHLLRELHPYCVTLLFVLWYGVQMWLVWQSITQQHRRAVLRSTTQKMSRYSVLRAISLGSETIYRKVFAVNHTLAAVRRKKSSYFIPEVGPKYLRPF